MAKIKQEVEMYYHRDLETIQQKVQELNADIEKKNQQLEESGKAMKQLEELKLQEQNFMLKEKYLRNLQLQIMELKHENSEIQKEFIDTVHNEDPQLDLLMKEKILKERQVKTIQSALKRCLGNSKDVCNLNNTLLKSYLETRSALQTLSKVLLEIDVNNQKHKFKFDELKKLASVNQFQLENQLKLDEGSLILMEAQKSVILF